VTIAIRVFSTAEFRITVYDVEKCGLRKFNLSTLIGRIAMVSDAHALSFCR
jgi:hypothetical protein